MASACSGVSSVTLILTCQKIAREIKNEGVKLSYALGSCDGRYFTYNSIPTVKMGVCGFDADGHRMFHRADEFVTINDIRLWTKIFKAVALNYVGGEKEQTNL